MLNSQEVVPSKPRQETTNAQWWEICRTIKANNLDVAATAATLGKSFTWLNDWVKICDVLPESMVKDSDFYYMELSVLRRLYERGYVLEKRPVDLGNVSGAH